MNGPLEKDILMFHIELTNKCALRCSRCPRTKLGNAIKLKELSIETIKSNFPEDLCKRIKEVSFSGAYGDPIYATDFLKIIKYFVDNNIEYINIETNGSGKRRDFWIQLAGILRMNDCVIFSIDGLEDTNHIYREGSNWAQVMEAAQILKDRPSLIWKFIIFKHNQHQIEKAQTLAKKKGFLNFQIVKSNLFGILCGQPGPDPLMPDLQYTGDKFQAIFKASKQQNTNIKRPHINNEIKIDPSCIQGNRHFLASDGTYTPCCWTSYKQDFISSTGINLEMLSVYKKDLKSILEDKNIAKKLISSLDPKSPCKQFCKKTDKQNKKNITYHDKTKIRLKD